MTPTAHRLALVAACAAATWPRPWVGAAIGLVFTLLAVLAERLL